MLYVCGSCQATGRLKVHACLACGAVGGMRVFGSDPSDGGHPAAAKFPVPKTAPPSAAPSPSVPVQVEGEPEAPAGRLVRPALRAPIKQWREWATAVGHHPDRVEVMSKRKLTALEPVVPVGA